MESTLNKYTWEGVLLSVNVWLNDVKRDVDMPDLWADLQRQRQILSADTAELVENTPFTSAEQAEISKRLREIRVYVENTQSLSTRDLLALENRLGLSGRGRATPRPARLAQCVLGSSHRIPNRDCAPAGDGTCPVRNFCPHSGPIVRSRLSPPSRGLIDSGCA
jgi:hypothetical protein